MTTTATQSTTGSPAAAPPRGRLAAWLLGPRDQPTWVRPAVLALLCLTAAGYLVNLTANGYANDFYAAAVQAGTQNWKAWLFGSLDPSNAITVDKPPAALWVMVLFGRTFGFSSASMLVPQALEGVAAVGLLYAAVRRWSGPGAGLLAGAGLALTPVAALMFRFNNPDALLVLLLVAAAYCTVRATESARIGWLLAAGVLLGFGFLTKMMQAFLIVPGLALVYLVAAPTGMWRRVGHLLAGGVAMVVSAGWYIALVGLWPASARPYVGGSTDNSLLQLALGYNGFGRVLGGEDNHTPGAPAGGSGAHGAGFGGHGGPGGAANQMFGGSAGIGRLFGESFAGQAAWLLPAALIGLVAGLWFTRRSSRAGRTRAALMLWGGWLLVTGLVFSFMQGIVHPYYTVALAPAIAALVAVSGRELWRGRDHAGPRWVLAVMVAVTAAWSFVLLDRTPTWLPALRWVVLVVGLVVALLLAVGAGRWRRLATVTAVLAVLVGVTGPAAYAVDTVGQSETGGIPVAGPASAGMGGFGAHGFPGGPGGANAPGGDSARGHGAAMAGGHHGGPGRMSSNPVVNKLVKATTTKWAAATVGSQQAASIELATGKAVLAVGGFSGTDNAPTLAQFQQDVRAGEIRYFVAGGPFGGGPGGPGGQQAGKGRAGQSGTSGPGFAGHHMGGPGSSGSAAAITKWVESHFAKHTVGGETVYDLRS